MITIAYTDLHGGENEIDTNNNGYVNWLEGNIDTYPCFIDPLNYDFALNAQSPCIDSGIDFLEWNGNTIIDLEEDDFCGLAPDMGCYEYGTVDNDEFKIENVKCKISNFPNPFNPTTAIRFTIPNNSRMDLTIYNIKGQRIREWKIDNVKCKINFIIWNGVDESNNKVSSGIDYYSLSVNGKTKAVNKCLLLK
jgi:hypothetical protein